ncbi:hypothetical protein quinque_005426 [Culex quinquefasciatus]
MKLLACAVLLLVGLTVANGSTRKIDWSLVRPISEFPHVAKRIQDLTGLKTGFNSGSNQRIVGGQNASPGQFPYQAAVLTDIAGGIGLCGGVLISSNFILTAAVCVDGASEGTVILGAQNLQNENEAGQVRIDFSSSDIRVHEQYLEFIFRHNIAVVRLPTPAPMTDRIQPARLPAVTDSRTFAGMAATVSGFGRTSDASTSFSDVLRYVFNPILTNADCGAGWWGDLIDGQKLCLSNVNGRGPCVGDDGGPLTILEGGQTLLVGVHSFGSVLGCEVNWPAVFQDQQILNSEAALLISGGSKISSGSIALTQQFPHQAAILINFPDGSGTLCGGTIISSTFILTAAHCLDGAIDAVVVVGTNTISIPSDAQAVEIDVTFHDMLVHPKYDPVDVLNDIAILRLTKALIFTDKIQPIRFPSRREAQVDLVNLDATVSGWGALSGDEFAEISDTLKLELRYVSNPVISNAVCGKVFQDMIHDFHVCVSGDNGRNACQGDSGGPLSASMGGKTTLVRRNDM